MTRVFLLSGSFLGIVTSSSVRAQEVGAREEWQANAPFVHSAPVLGNGNPAGALGANTDSSIAPAGYFPPASTSAGDAGSPDPYLNDILRRLETTEARLEYLSAERVELERRLQDRVQAEPEPEKPKEKSWFEKYRVRGYVQMRISETMAEEGAAPSIIGDSSVGENQSFIVRRARLIFQGDMTDRVSVYLQPDFASTPNGAVDGIQFTQIRDWYADVHLDDEKIHRFRVGQSKIPYGWENLQSSSNRLPFDRNDALNSAAKNERDLGVFYYWTPTEAQDFFKYVLDEGLKGSGNYGVFGFGAYNGQGGSLREVNDDLHLISRLTLPYRFNNGQLMEVGIQGYTGLYSVYGDEISPLGVGPIVEPFNTIGTGDGSGIIDRRIAGTWVWYPQPLGFQAEWTVGRGPGLSEDQTSIVDRPLYGGYLMSMYRYKTESRGEFIPFARWNYYKGGYKSEKNSPFVEIDEIEAGVEWQIGKNVELTTMYTITDRTNTKAIDEDDTPSYLQFEGQVLRFQLQINY